MDKTGNLNLRLMSTGKARSQCRIALRDDPEATAKYKQYCHDESDVKRTYGSAYRAVERGSPRGLKE
jgi:hypothetical protein